ACSDYARRTADWNDADGALPPLPVCRRERDWGLSVPDACNRAEPGMRHVQHLSLESLVKMDHFQKEPPLNSTGTTNRIRVAAERNCTMLDALALEILDKGPKRRSSRLVSANPPGLYGQALKAFRIEDMSIRRGQNNLRRVLPGGNLGGRGFALLVLGVIALWGFSGFFRVEPDELGVVLRFGKAVREVQPGLNYHLPYPIEIVLTPKALRVN